ncbi:hypothetical protein ACW9JB_31860, partial [Pseudomonas sp. SDO558_S425]
LRPSWLTGPADQNQKQIKIKGTQPRWRSTTATGGVALLFCRSWLAGDADNSVHQVHPVDAIAGKPAPTFDRARF